MRRISYRGPESTLSADAAIETEPTTVDQKIGLKILKEIVAEENAPLEDLTKAKAQKYKDKLLDLADELSESQVDYDKEKAIGVLNEWQKTPFVLDDSYRDSSPLGSRGAILLSAYLSLFILALLYFLFKLWPRWDPFTQYWNAGISILWFAENLDLEVRLILIVAAAGGLGSLVHALRSLAAFIGDRTLASSWILWYISRPFIGMATAVVFYFVLRATTLLESPPQSSNKFFLIAAVSSIVGMFSDRMTTKLDEVFSIVFRSNASSEPFRKRTEPQVNVNPSITAISPAIGPASGGTAVNITGYDFNPKASVTFGGVPAVAVAFVDVTSINAVTPPHEAGICDVEIINPDGLKAIQPAQYAYIYGE